MICGLDIDGVLCDIGPGVAARIAERFGVASHPSTWRSYDLRQLSLGIPEARFSSFLDELFDEPGLYAAAPLCSGAPAALAGLRAAGWSFVGITARPAHLAGATRAWLDRHRLPVGPVHHAAVGSKAAVAEALGVEVMVEDNPAEAELLGAVCESWLLDRPYNRGVTLTRSQRLWSWQEAVGRLCQRRLFA